MGDTQFLKSLIPHHGGAILMCGKAAITDSRIERLCEGIRASQQSEIETMKAILSELEP